MAHDGTVLSVAGPITALPLAGLSDEDAYAVLRALVLGGWLVIEDLDGTVRFHAARFDGVV